MENENINCLHTEKHASTCKKTKGSRSVTVVNEEGRYQTNHPYVT